VSCAEARLDYWMPCSGDEEEAARLLSACCGTRVLEEA
jgi:hypothetical protein